MSSSPRYAYLDLIRTIAIVMVVFSHTIQMLPSVYPWIKEFAEFGKYGVDIFFVLSGFLIGKLFWREAKQQEQVNLLRFYMRRAFRTMPPYFIALILAFVSVNLQRDQSFYWQYLVFLQNYLERIPFFLVSWSLCIEEHFYAFLPFFLGLTYRRLSPNQLLVLIFLCSLIPLLLRNLFVSNHNLDTFGYYLTATHFRFEGLLMGVAIANIAENNKRLEVPFFLRVCIYLFTVVFMLCSYTYSAEFMNLIGYTLMAMLISMTLLLLFYEKNFLNQEIKIVKNIALISYSIYLTHALAIHVALKSSQRFGVDTPILIWLTMLIVVIGSGFVFYKLVEKPSMAIRDRLFA